MIFRISFGLTKSSISSLTWKSGSLEGLCVEIAVRDFSVIFTGYLTSVDKHHERRIDLLMFTFERIHAQTTESAE
jgi:hypothetical protein